jgi:benzoyl-CoA 2,3-dioxygenase component B
VSLDLFGGETSTNVANYYTAGLKGRWLEERRSDDHQLTGESIFVDALVDGQVGATQVPALTALNTDLRREYIADCEGGVKRWNRILAEAGLPQRLKLPHVAFNRKVGAFAGIEATPVGVQLSAAEWELRKGQWLPSDTDRALVRSLMRPVYKRGKIAGWLAPPRNGINGQPFDYDYVHLARRPGRRRGGSCSPRATCSLWGRASRAVRGVPRGVPRAADRPGRLTSRAWRPGDRHLPGKAHLRHRALPRYPWP